MKHLSCICAMIALLILIGCKEDECNKSAIIYINNHTDCEIGAKAHKSDGMVLDNIIVNPNQINEAFLVIPVQQIPGDFTIRIFGNTEESCLSDELLITKTINTGCIEYDPVNVIE